MRITRLDLSGFRAFARSVTFDLDSDAVIIAGENGQGKTSIFDGIYWAITGKISRLGDDARSVISIYSKSGQATATLTLSDASGGKLAITRSTDGENQSISLTVGESRYRGKRAALFLLDALWPGSSEWEEGADRLDIAISRSVYLQQDILRDFIEADSRADRFRAVSELIGTGEITDLQHRLESSKKLWSEITNQKDNELINLRHRVDSLRARSTEMEDSRLQDLTQLDQFWKSWWTEIENLELDVKKVPNISSPEAASSIDTAIRQTDSSRRSFARRADRLQALVAEFEQQFQWDDTQLEKIDKELEDLENAIQACNEELSHRQQELVEARKTMREMRDARDELKTLAQIALRHLGDRCPVCTQEFDEEITQEHLRSLIDQQENDLEPIELADTVRDLKNKLDELNSMRNRLLEQKNEALVEKEKWLARETSNRQQLVEFGIDHELDDKRIVEEISNSLVHAREVSDKLLTLRERGEELAARLADAAEAAQRVELIESFTSLQREEADLDRVLKARIETGNLAGRIIDELRNASSLIVDAQLNEIAPLLQRLYSRLDPHPTLRVVKLLSRFHYGRGRLMAQIDDPREKVSTQSPEAVLSSSQLNALAVSIFLAFNLGLPRIPLGAALLDDPFQALDEINVLGLVDLLRRFVNHRQLIVSTHDPRILSLLQRKLRPTIKDRATKVIELSGWDRSGPNIRQFEIPVDQLPIRIAA